MSTPTTSAPPRRILLAIGGGIAAYKSADLCSKLVQAGHHVQVMMTHSAGQFIGSTTLAALSGRPVVTESFATTQPLGPHIELTRGIDMMVVVPTTANLLAKFAAGLADDLVSTAYLQNTAPVLLAPAMSDAMWNHVAVQRNVKTLRDDGCYLIGPDEGWLSCRVRGSGRLSDPSAIAKMIQQLLPPTASS